MINMIEHWITRTLAALLLGILHIVWNGAAAAGLEEDPNLSDDAHAYIKLIIAGQEKEAFALAERVLPAGNFEDGPLGCAYTMTFVTAMDREPDVQLMQVLDALNVATRSLAAVEDQYSKRWLPLPLYRQLAAFCQAGQGRLYGYLNTHDKASDAYAAALRNSPSSAATWKWYGDLLSKTDPRSALRSYAVCYLLDPNGNSGHECGALGAMLSP